MVSSQIFRGVSLFRYSDSPCKRRDRTPCRTHICRSLVVSRTSEHIQPSHARACGSRLKRFHWSRVVPLRTQSSSHLTACFTEHFSAYLTPSHRFVPRLHRRHPLRDRSLESGVRPCATSPEGRQYFLIHHASFGH